MAGWIARWITPVLALLLVAAAAAYALDWALWRVRVSHGNGYGAVTVSRFVVAPLKGNKVEYYPDRTGEERCSRSMFGQGSIDACWWMARHRVVFE